MLVCKFGGTSLADARCFRRVADIIRSDQRRRCIIVSAPGRSARWDDKVTDLLIESARSPAALARVREIFTSISSDLGLRSYARELASLDNAVRSGRDAAASRGEWLCAMMLSEYLNMPFIDAKDVFRFTNSAPNISLTYESLRARVKTGAVIPGFYGSDESGRIVTFPRGGSDICGALAAAALDCEGYENWTDVSGIFTADPAIIPGSRPIPTMSYSRARLITMAGAGVLHWGCIDPAQEAGVPIIIKNTFAPEHPGTVISQNEDCGLPCIALAKAPSGDVRIVASPVCENAYVHIYAALPENAKANYQQETLTVTCPEDTTAQMVRLIHSRLEMFCKP